MKKLLCIIFFILFTTTLFAQNNCLDFDGTDDYVDCGNNTSLNPGEGSFTIESWIRPDGLSGTKRFIWKNNGSTPPFDGYYFMTTDDRLMAGFGDGSNSIEVEISGLTTGSWYHVVMIRDVSADKVSLYLNGVKVNEKTDNTSNIGYSGDFAIGGRPGEPEWFDGQMDEVRIWNDARTEAEIRTNMYKELAGTESNLAAYYKLNETSGTNADDSKSGGINDGTWNGSDGGSYTSAEWQTSSSFFGPKNCLDFDGSNDYVDCVNDASLTGMAELTLEAWVRPDVADVHRVIISNFGGSGSGGGYQLVTLDNETFAITIRDQNLVDRGADGTSILSDGNWYHVAGTMDWDGSKTTLKLYVNGILETTETYTGAEYQISYTNVSNLFIGTNSDGVPPGWGSDTREFDGLIDEVRIWNDVRTAEEIQQNMCRTLDGDEANLAAYYRFDQQATSGQTTLYDITSNENSGTLTDMDATTDWVTCTAFDTWIGWFDTSWGESKNWSRGIPTATENVGLFKWTLGHAPTVSSPSTAKTMIVGLLETLTLNSSLTVDGNLIELGNLNLNSQTVTLAGTSSQYLVGSLDFYDLTINNSSSDKKVSAWWTTSLKVDNNLTVTDGIFYSKSDYTNVSIASEGTLELSGDITVSGNWDNDGAFTHNDHKVTFDGSLSQTIQGDNLTTFYDMKVDNTSGVVLSNSNTVNNTLDLNSDSKITLGSNTLTIGSSGSIANVDPDSYIVTNGSGVLKRNSVAGYKTFPIGNSSYNPAFINNSETVDNFSVKVADGTPSNISDATRVVNRTWTITEDVAGGSNVAIMLQWNDGETGGSFNISDDLVMGRYLGSGTNWESKSASGSGSGPYAAEASGFTSFSDFVVASGGSGTLPIVLSTFTAQFIENTPTIHWSTQSETDNMGWFVYRNVEEDFATSEKVSEFIEGHGTTTQQQSYVFEDIIQNTEVSDTYYYWLESIDYSGIINHYDKVAILTIPDNSNSGNQSVLVPERFGLLQNEPNPVVHSTRIAFNLTETSMVDLNVYNLKGQLVNSLYSGVTSKHTIMWDGKDEQDKELENGVYFYNLIVNGKVEDTKKLILMR